MTQSILYTSTAKLPDDESLQVKPLFFDDLVENACVKNKACNISGVLSYKDGKIIQLIEGEPSQLKKLFAKISNDYRHRNLLVLLDIKDSHRIFSGWDMVFDANIEISFLFQKFLFAHFENLVDMNDQQRDELIYFIDHVFYEVIATKKLQ